MKQVLAGLLAALLAGVATPGMARDDVGDYSIAQALSSAKARSRRGEEVVFHFGDEFPLSAAKNLGSVKTNKKTNAFGKTDEEACQWVFLSALLALKKRAVNEGADAVVNIKSNYRNNETTSETTFQCGAGAIIAGVALKGTLVKVD